MKGISGIFWLDAHYSGGDTAGTGKKAPVEDELTILMQCKETHCILIDDARFFEAPLSRISGEYPGLSVIISLVDWKRYAVFIVDDVILLLPANEANNELVHKYVWKQDFLRTRRTFCFYWNALKTGNIKGFLVGILLLSGFYSINKKRN